MIGKITVTLACGPTLLTSIGEPARIEANILSIHNGNKYIGAVALSVRSSDSQVRGSFQAVSCAALAV